MAETRELVNYLSDLKYDDIPTEVASQAKLCILDTVGVALCANQRPWTKIVNEIASELSGVGESTVWGDDFRVPPQYAALVNGTAAHGIEMDDRNPPAGMHAGSAIVPAALAAGEKAGSDGRELITAVVAGYDAAFRVGYAMKGIGNPGIHSPGHRGIWGAVAATSKVLDLDQDQMLDAFGLAGSMASGLWEFPHNPEGTMVKRLYGGWPAHNGVMACLLARKGLTGPSTVLEGKHGYCRTFTRDDEEPYLGELTNDLGGSFKIMDREVKPYAAWGGGHLAIDAAGHLKSQHDIQPEDIEKIEVGGSSKLIRMHEMEEPQSLMAGQYSLPFLTAITLSRGAESLMDPDEVWNEEIFQDREIKNLVNKTSIYIDDELDEIYRREHTYGGADITVTFEDGTQESKVVYHSKGMLQNPMTAQEIHDKFDTITSQTLTASKRQETAELIDSLETVKSVREVTDLLYRDTST